MHDPTVAVLFNAAGVRLGEHAAGADCQVIEFGGAVFVRTVQTAKLEAGGWGAAFDETAIHVVRDLDRCSPRRGVTALEAQRRREVLA